MLNQDVMWIIISVAVCFYLIIFIKAILEDISSMCAKKVIEKLTEINNLKKDYDSIDFDDVITSEVMVLRYDLVRLISLIDNANWKNIPRNFMQYYFLFSRYPESAICELYKNSQQQWCGIIILLSGIDDLLNPQEISAKRLKEIHSPVRKEIKKGDVYDVYIYDTEIDDRFDEITKMSLVVSAIQDSRGAYTECFLVLKINLDSNQYIKKKICVGHLGNNEFLADHYEEKN